MGGAPHDYYLLSFLRQPALANCPLRLDMIFTFRLYPALLMHTSPVTMSLTVYEFQFIILRQVNRHQSTHERNSPCLVSVLFWQPREPMPAKLTRPVINGPVSVSFLSLATFFFFSTSGKVCVLTFLHRTFSWKADAPVPQRPSYAPPEITDQRVKTQVGLLQ